jgi:hypothetical protein
VERLDARRWPDDTRRAQPNRWPNGMAESNVSELRGKNRPALDRREVVAALNRLKAGYGLHAPQKADSEIFNKFGPASGAAGVPCVIMTSCPMDSLR